LQHLNYDACGSDLGEPIPKADDYIVATPTDTHFETIVDIKLKYPDARILCEKPISKDWDEIRALEKYAGTLFMVNNYQYLEHNYSAGGTYYNYYNSGNDGLYWDCIQLIHLAESDIYLNDKSPEWVVTLNGHYLNRDSIDYSYIMMVRDFLKYKKCLWGYEDILQAHEKTLELIEEQNGG